MSMDVQDIRRRNIRDVINNRFNGTQAALAKAVGCAPTEISRLFTMGKEKRRTFTDGFARKIETKLSLPRGWLDRLHGEVANVDGSARIPVLEWGDIQEHLQQGQSMAQHKRKSVLCPVEHGNRSFAVEVNGMSMEPRFMEGDLVFIDPDRAPSHKSIVLSEKNGVLMLRELVVESGKQYLKALNPAWPDNIVELGKGKVIGTAIYRGERL